MAEDQTRIDRLEDKVASLQTSMSHGFGQLQAEITHLRQLVEQTLAKPPPAAPAWLVLVGVGACTTGLASLIVGVAQLVR